MKTFHRNLALLAMLLTGLFYIIGEYGPALFNKRPPTDEIVKEGLSIALAITPVRAEKAEGLRAGLPARLQFTVKEASSQEPVKGLHPAVWLDRQNPQEKDLSCKDRINSYLQSQLAFSPRSTSTPISCWR